MCVYTVCAFFYGFNLAFVAINYILTLMGDNVAGLLNLIINTFGYTFWKTETLNICSQRHANDDLSEAADH